MNDEFIVDTTSSGKNTKTESFSAELSEKEQDMFKTMSNLEGYILDSRRRDKMYSRYAKYYKRGKDPIDSMLLSIQAKEEAKVKEFRDKCLEYHDGLKTDDKGEVIKYETGSTCGNIVGDRIRVMLDKYNLSITHFEKVTKINRSSLQRFLRKDAPDVPSLSNLIVIIRSFPCSVEDFVYAADNFEKWKDGFLNGYLMPWGKKTIVDYEMLKVLVPDLLEHILVYTVDEKRYKVPQHIVELLAKQINVAFEMTDLLLELEKNGDHPLGYYDLPTREEIEEMFYIGI